MQNQFYDFSWQAVGISSDTSIKRDPISLHMQNYLKWGSQNSRRHLVIVDDELQAYNYIYRRGYDNQTAIAFASTKGRRKLKDLEIVANANELDNINFTLLSNVRRHSKEIEDKIWRLYFLDKRIREIVQKIIPKRFSSEPDLLPKDIFAFYIIGEAAISLHLGKTRISTTKQIQRDVNDLITLFHNDYDIGNSVDFVYPLELGQECEIGKRGKVEPYSASYKEHRLLLTDSLRCVFNKVSQADLHERNEFSRWLSRSSGKSLHPIKSLYQEQIKPARQALLIDDIVRNTRNIIGYSLLGIFTSFWITANTLHTLGMNKHPEKLKSFVEIMYQRYK